MKFNRARAKGVSLVLVGALAAFPLSAGLIPGVPDLVWDPIQEGHMVQALAHDLQNIAILSRSLERTEDNMRALPWSVKSRFRGYTQPFHRHGPGNLFGETAYWSQLAAGTLGDYQKARDAWDKAGTPLRPSPLFANKVLGSPAMSRLAGVEISDGAAQNAMATVDALRSQHALHESALKNLQSSCQDETNDSAAEQADCASATAILQAQAGQTTNDLLAAGIDLQTARLKTERDREAQRVNFESRVLEYQATEPTSVDLSTDSLRNFRFNFGGN